MTSPRVLPINFLNSVLLLVFIGILTPSVFSQPSKIVQGGVIAGVPYASTGFENINLTNGALNMNFPLPTLQGRGGVSHGYQLTYSSKLWQTVTNPIYDPFYTPTTTYQTFMAENPASGWTDQSAYEVRLWDRTSTMDAQGGPICEDGRIWQHVYKWKLEIVAPGGRTIEFRPAGYTDDATGLGTAPRGYFNVKPDGTEHNVVNCTTTTSTPSGNRMTYYSIDSSGIRLTFANNENLGFVWEMSMPDGSRVIAKVGGGQKIIDKNGNYIESTTVTLPDSTQTGGWIDEVGRWIAAKSISTDETHYFQKGFDGELLTWKVFWKDVFVRKPFVTTCASGCPGAERGPVTNQELIATLRVVDRIELPIEMAQSQYATYAFEYHAKDQEDSNDSSGWGEVKSVTIPTGAKISYGYPLSALDPEDEYDELYQGELYLRTDQILERSGSLRKKLLEFDETYDGQTTSTDLTWEYGISRTSSSVTGPDGGVSTQYFHNIVDDESKGGQVYKETRPAGTIVEKVWVNNYPVGTTFGTGHHTNALVKTEVVTIPDASGSPSLSLVKDHNFDMNGNLMSTAEYDWISASSSAIQRTNGIVTGFTGLTPVRTSTTSYYNATPAYTSTSASTNAYYFSTAPLFRNLTAVSEVMNASNTTVAKNETYYDNSTSLSAAPTAGNQTLSRSWDNALGSVSSPLTDSNSIKNQATYNAYGLPLTTTDPKGTVTQITYGNVAGPTGNVTNLYPTQTIAAYGTNLARTSTAVYDFYTGLVTSATDEDNDVTNATDYDDFGRPEKVITAQGTELESWTQTTYDDVNRRVIVKSDINAKGDAKKVAIQHFDQLGRVRLTRTLEDPATESVTDEEHGIKVQTRYKVVSGYTYQLTSNPYRAATSSAASSDPTMGWTRSKVWDTGIKQEVETFLGTGLPEPWASSSPTSTGKVTTVTDADRTLVTDQTEKSRISKTNGIGQLIEVWEILPGSGTGSESVTFPNTSIAHGFKTTYSYDTLNNLTAVAQGSQARSFTYSSLSRLLTANNPESGTLAYVYDKNGNLTKKTDARNVETNYTYDALNRVTQRAYATPNPSPSPSQYQATPTVSYTYGTTAPMAGKLTKVESSVSTTEYTSSDILGRVTGHLQTTDGTAYEMFYSYNLAGALVDQWYPSGRHVKNLFDANGDLARVLSRDNVGEGFFPYADSLSYNAAGALTSMQLGNGRWESTVFNSRLQPTQIALGVTPGATNLLKLDYSYGDWVSGSVDATKNNGNIAKQVITVPTVGSYSGFIATQKYYYDSLNRLDDSTEEISSTQTWRQDFTYDRYGNRNLVEANTTTLQKNCGTSPNLTMCTADAYVFNPGINSQNSNRMNPSQGYSYDAAGNTLTDATGKSYVYDGENKQVKASNGGGTLGEYFYDGDGRRVKKIVPGTGETTIFVYDAAGKLVAEYSTIIEGTSTAKVAYLTSDHLGSPRINTDANGAVIARHDYHSFGEEISTSQRTSSLGYTADIIRKQFTSYERDGETNLDFAQARMYGNSHGRFTSPDPTLLSVNGFNPQSWNRYVYVLNNPYLYTDPLGLWEIYYEDRFKDKKNKDGTITKVFDRREVFARKTKEGDDGASLAKQLGLKGKDATKFADKIGGGDNIQLSKQGGDVGRVFNAVESGLTEQKKFEDKNPGKGGEGPRSADCSETACKIAYPQQLFAVLTFSVQEADQIITGNNSKSVQESDLRIADIVRWAKDGNPTHFASFIFRNDNGVPMVFSKSGARGPFETATTNDPRWSSYGYGAITGIKRSDTGYYRP